MWSTSAIHRRQYTLERSARIVKMDLCRSDAFAPNILRLLSVLLKPTQLHSLFYFRSFCSRIFSEYIKFYRESFCINKQFELEFPIQIFIGKCAQKKLKYFRIETDDHSFPFSSHSHTAHTRPDAHTYTKRTLEANKTIFQWILIHNVVEWHEREWECVYATSERCAPILSQLSHMLFNALWLRCRFT